MAGTYTAVLALDGKEVDRRDISVRPGQSQKVSFQLPTTAAGDHKIAIGQSTAAVTFWDWKTHVIKYDTTEMGVKPVLWFAKGEFGHIVHFTPPTLPFKVRKLLAYGGAFVTDQKDLDKKTITVRIWNKDKSRQVWTGDFPWRLFFSTERWREMDIPNVRVEDDFHVEIVTHSEDMRYEGTKEIASAVAIAYTEGDEAPRSNISYAGKPLQKTEKVQRLVWCIRVEGEGPPQ